jgi:hypothetical protein
VDYPRRKHFEDLIDKEGIIKAYNRSFVSGCYLVMIMVTQHIAQGKKFTDILPLLKKDNMVDEPEDDLPAPQYSNI